MIYFGRHSEVCIQWTLYNPMRPWEKSVNGTTDAVDHMAMTTWRVQYVHIAFCNICCHYFRKRNLCENMNTLLFKSWGSVIYIYIYIY